jgi:CRISPR-associated protein Csd1
MLLQALYDYAASRQLLENLPFEDRTIQAIIPLDAEGTLRLLYVVPQTTVQANGKDRLGCRLRLPSFPGEPNGGKAYFLAENATAVFGRNKITGEPIWSDPAIAPKSAKNDSKLFQDFWRQIAAGYEITHDFRLGALLKFRDRYLSERASKIDGEFSFLVTRTKDKARTADKTEFVAKTGPDDKQFIPTKDAVFAFSVDGNLVTFGDEQDPLREFWKKQFARDFSAANAGESAQLADGDNDDESEAPIESDAGKNICIVSGAIGHPIARSHNPKIRGVPYLTSTGVTRSNGRIVSFAKAAPAFSSYGFAMGENATVSQDAASSYALALNSILRDENARFDVGPLAFCIWSKERPNVGSQFKRLLERGFPEHVQDVLRSLYAGVEREKVRKSERLHTVVMTCATKARVAIKYWIDLPLAHAEAQFENWWNDLRIASLAPIGASIDSSGLNIAPETWRSPYGLRELVMATVRQSKDHKDDKLVGDRIVQLYRAALEGTAPSLMLLKPILDEFHTALVKDDPKDAKKRTYPYSQSRFALIKLILLRNAVLPKLFDGTEGDFMELADTFDEAYNCGRLLAVMEALQNRSRLAGKPQEDRKKTDRPGAGVIARYYGRASTAPATVFSLLLGLSHHHESKLQKGTEADKKAAAAFERHKIEILSRLRPNPNEPNSAPNFPRILKLAEQGRFALGFYQQKAHDLESLRRYRATQGKEGNDLADVDDETLETPN